MTNSALTPELKPSIQIESNVPTNIKIRLLDAGVSASASDVFLIIR